MTIEAAIIVAVIGAALKYVNDLAVARRKDRLERLSLQLRDLYGPLYSLDRAAREAWLTFRKLHRPKVSAFWDPADPPSAEDAAAWRLWMTEVFMPINLRMEQAIVGHADLLIEPQIPRCLLDFCAHVAAYKAIMKQWGQDDFSHHVASVSYPWEPLRKYVTDSYELLMHGQAVLLSKKQLSQKSRA